MTGNKIMQRSSHTWIATIRDAVEVWRKQNGWSRETAAQMIVEAHEREGLHRVTGIVFDPHTRDAYERMKVNADRIFRWLDDATKDNNLLCANFVPSILAALPADLRMHLVDDLLRGHGMACRMVVTESGDTPIGMLRAMMIESSEAQQAVAALLDGEDPGELEHAQRQIAEAMEVLRNAQDMVESMMSGGGGVMSKNRYNKMMWRVRCPHCDNLAQTRSSRPLSEITREIYFQCTNPECGHTWVALLSAIRTLVTSRTPNSKVHIPVSDKHTDLATPQPSG